MASKIFKKCPMCKEEWRDRKKFIDDAELRLEGYQADFDRIEAGLVYFTHMVDGCYSTMTIRAEEFFDLNPEKPFATRKTGTEECPEYCLHRDNLDPCQAECECAYVRDLLQILKSMKSREKQRQELDESVGGGND